MPCYRARSNHTSNVQNEPGAGQNWTTYWEECACCPITGPSSSSSSPSGGGASSSSSSVSGGGTSSSSSSVSGGGASSSSSSVSGGGTSSSSSSVSDGGTSSSSSNVSGGGTSSSSSSVGGGSSSSSSSSASASSTSGGGVGTIFVGGMVPDWNQPNYYEASGAGRTNIATNPFTNPLGETPAYPTPYSNTWAHAWCAPTAAACQLGHLQHHYAPILTTPNWIGDNADAGPDPNPDLNTTAWDSIPGFGDFLVDGPTHRFDIGANQGASLMVRTTDFGWWMNTNNKGRNGTIMGAATLGTWTEQIYKGLHAFYSHAGYTNMVGFVYHQGAPGEQGRVPPYASSWNDQTKTWEVIKTSIDNNRTVIASTFGWRITKLTTSPRQLSTQSAETHADYYAMDSVGAGLPYIDGTQIQNLEYYNEATTAQGLGHTVLIVGYIESGTPDDIAPSLSKPATNWIIVRDNFSQTHRNVALPFDQAIDTTAGLNAPKSFWEHLTATFYTNPTGASFSSRSQSSSGAAGGTTSSSSSSSSTSASSGSGGGVAPLAKYHAITCVLGNFSDALYCDNWFAEWNAANNVYGHTDIAVNPADDDITSQYWAAQYCTNLSQLGTHGKIAWIKGVTALNSGNPVCCLLIRDDANITSYSIATEVSTGYQDCTVCNNNLP